MLTANEWYRKINSYSNPDKMNDVEREWVEKNINDIQKEAIEECAWKIKADENGYPVALSVSILSLIKDLK